MPSIAQPTPTQGRLDRMVLRDGLVTLMVKNVPILYTAKELLTEFGQHCDMQSCSMLHLPSKSHSRRSVGYAFITFTDPLAAHLCAYTMSGRAWSVALEQSYCTIAAAHLQGITANLTSFVLSNEKKRLQSPPLVFSNGEQIDFVEAVRMHCAESVLRELRRKCHCIEEPEQNEPHFQEGGVRCDPRCQKMDGTMYCTTESESHSSSIQKSLLSGRQRVKDVGFRSTSASSSGRAEDEGFFRSEVTCVDKGVPVHGSLLSFGLLPRPRQRSDVFEAQLRIVTRVSL